MEYIALFLAQIHSQSFECHQLIDRDASYLDSIWKKKNQNKTQFIRMQIARA